MGPGDSLVGRLPGSGRTTLRELFESVHRVKQTLVWGVVSARKVSEGGRVSCVGGSVPGRPRCRDRNAAPWVVDVRDRRLARQQDEVDEADEGVDDQYPPLEEDANLVQQHPVAEVWVDPCTPPPLQYDHRRFHFIRGSVLVGTSGRGPCVDLSPYLSFGVLRYGCLYLVGSDAGSTVDGGRETPGDGVG